MDRELGLLGFGPEAGLLSLRSVYLLQSLQLAMPLGVSKTGPPSIFQGGKS